MKKALCIPFLLCLALSSVVFADPVYLGLKGGIDFSNISNTGGVDFGGNTALGYNYGIFVDAKLNDFLDLQPEIYIGQKGNYSSIPAGAPATYLNSYSLNYLELAMLFKTNVFSIRKLKVNLLAGPEVSYLYEESNPSPYGYTLLNTTTPVLYNNADYGLIMGVSFEYENFVLDGRYDMGLNGIFENGLNGFAFNGGLNRVFTISAGYKFEISRKPEEKR